jgi:hypothetical protein
MGVDRGFGDFSRCSLSFEVGARKVFGDCGLASAWDLRMLLLTPSSLNDLGAICGKVKQSSLETNVHV